MDKKLYEPYTTGVKTSKNIPVACSEFAVNNALQTVLYGEKENTIIFDKIKQAVPGTTVGTIDTSKQINPGSLWFVLYNDPNMEPNEEGYTPELPEDLDASPDTFPVFSFKPTSKFTDNKFHTCLGIFYGGRRLKIKHAGINSDTGLPFFYVEDPFFTKVGNKWECQQAKWYGTFFNKVNSSSFGKKRKTTKKRNTFDSDIRYLLNLKC
jgi:hypothetical protein